MMPILDRYQNILIAILEYSSELFDAKSKEVEEG